MNLEVRDIIAIGALLVAIVGQLIQYFGVIYNMKADIRVLEEKMSIFWKSVERSVDGMLKHPIHPRKDYLLENFYDLNEDDLTELKKILTDEQARRYSKEGMSSEVYALALCLKLAQIDSLIIEREICGDYLLKVGIFRRIFIFLLRGIKECFS